MKKSYIRIKNLELTGMEVNELLILVRQELQNLDSMPTDDNYGKWVLVRQNRMNQILDKLQADDFKVVEVEEEVEEYCISENWTPCDEPDDDPEECYYIDTEVEE